MGGRGSTLIAVTGLILTFGSMCFADLDSGLVAYYACEGNGNDSSGNNNNGTLTGVLPQADRYANPNHALYFSGSSCITIPDSPALSIANTQSFSVCAWVNFTNNLPNYAGVFAKDAANTSQGFQLVVVQDYVAAEFHISGQTYTVYGTNTLNDGRWHLLTIVAERPTSTCRIFVDGTNQIAYQILGLLAADLTTSAPAFIGKDRQGNWFFNGAIDDVRVYKRALSAVEVQALYSEPNLGDRMNLQTLLQTNRQPAPSELANTSTGSFLGNFTTRWQTNIPLNPNQMTVVLTHGWKSNPDLWASNVASLILSKPNNSNLNIVAWDWRNAADTFTPFAAAIKTLQEGHLLGQALQVQLGSNYTQHIHFVGHSLGTLVNSSAANYLHDHGFMWTNTHMTLFDEAEIAANIVNAAIPYPSLAVGQPSIIYDRPLPSRAAWVDNYVSIFGRPHPEAANIALQLGGIADVATHPYPNSLSIFQTLKTIHGYPCQWYAQSILAPTNSPMGYRWSFESDSLSNAPPTNSYFIQVPGSVESDLLNVSDSTFVQVFTQPLRALAGTLKYSLVVPSKAVQISGQVIGQISEAVVYDSYAQDMNFLAGWSMSLALKVLPATASGPHPLNDGTNAPAYAWVPVVIPAGAQTMSMDLLLEGAASGASIQIGVSGTNVFALPAHLFEPGTTFNTGPIDVSLYRGRDAEIFVGLVGNRDTDATLTVSAIRFYSSPEPVLKARTDAKALVLSWPFWANGFGLEAAPILAQNGSWSTITNTPAIVNLQNTVTNPMIYSGAMFYRLKH